ncbi:MAG TPA: NADH-quinone oxidoreductase subunit J [Gammaproteobacteria bacterium]
MSFEQFVFYAFAVLLVLSAGMVITVRNPVHSALFLVLAFFASAALWILLEAEFLAITLVLVYVGAVMVLFLFVVMMLDINIVKMRKGFARYLPIGAIVAVLLLAVMVMAVGSEHFGLEKWGAPQAHDDVDYSNTKELGRLLYTEYLYPFEVAAMILLVAIVAAIALTLRRRPGTRIQSVDQQVAARRDERVRLVAMKAEERK